MTRVSPSRSSKTSPKTSPSGSPEAFTYLEALEKIIKKKNCLKKKAGNTELRHMAVLQASKQRLCKEIFRVCGSHMMWDLIELSPFEHMDFSQVDDGNTQGNNKSAEENMNASSLSSLPGSPSGLEQNNNMDNEGGKSASPSSGCSICDSSRCQDVSRHQKQTSYSSCWSPMEHSVEDDDPLQLNSFFNQLKQVPVSR